MSETGLLLMMAVWASAQAVLTAFHIKTQNKLHDRIRVLSAALGEERDSDGEHSGGHTEDPRNDEREVAQGGVNIG